MRFARERASAAALYLTFCATDIFTRASQKLVATASKRLKHRECGKAPCQIYRKSRSGK
jgi:hypothetical protein